MSQPTDHPHGCLAALLHSVDGVVSVLLLACLEYERSGHLGQVWCSLDAQICG